MSEFKIGAHVVLINPWLFVNIFEIAKIEEGENGKFAYFTNGYCARLTSLRHANADDDWRKKFGDQHGASTVSREDQSNG